MSAVAMLRAVRWTVAPLALFAAADAMAQLKPSMQTGSLIPVKPVALERRRAADVERGFAQCIYRKNPRAAAALLAHSDPLSSDMPAAGIKNLNQTFDMEECLGREAAGAEVELGLRMPSATIRTMLSEQSYLATQPRVPTLPDGAGETVPRSFVSAGEQLPVAKAMAALSDCVVFHDVAKADAIVRTAPGSSAEHDAAVALAPTFGGCLLQGQRFTLNQKTIRALVADGLWTRFARPPAR